MKKIIAIVLSIILILAITLPAAAISIVAVKSIKLANSNIALKVGQSTNIKVVFTPANTTQKGLTYVTGDKNVATLDSTGKIIGVGAGSTTITVYSAINKKLFAKCSITVSKPEQIKPMVTYSFLGYSTNIPIKPNNSYQHRYIKEKFNIDIKYQALPVDPMQLVQKVNLLAASNSLPDFMSMAMMSNYYDLADQGLFLELDSLLKKYGTNILKNTPDKNFKPYYVNGKIYAIPGIDRRATSVIYARKDWLDKLGMKPPTTLDEFHEMLRAFTFNDPDGNGKKDTYGFGERNVWSAMFGPIFGAYGFIPWFYTEDNGQLVMGLTSSKTKQVLVLLQQWYKEGIIDPEFITTNTDAWFQKIGIGKVGCAVAGVYTHQKLNDLIKPNTPNGSMMKIDCPVGPSGRGGVQAYGGYLDGAVLNKNIKNPERLLEVLDWMTTEDGIGILHYGEEGKQYKLKPEGGAEMLLPDMEQQEFGLATLNGRFFNPLRPVPYVVDKFAKLEDLKGFKIAEKAMILDPMQNIKIMATDEAPTINDNLLKGMFEVIIGKETPSGFQKYVDDWYAKGGKKITEEANQVWKKMK